jgi:hypothetical protein
MRFGDLKKAEAKEAAVKKRAAINKGYCGSCGDYDDATLIKIATFMCINCSISCGTPEATKKSKSKRSRASGLDLLSGNSFEDNRYAKVTLKGHYLDKCGVELNEKKAQGRSKKARIAGKASMESVFQIDDSGVAHEHTDSGELMGEGAAAARRSSIAYFFKHYYGAPPESEWHGRNGTLALIMRRVGIPDGSRASVLKVFRDVSEAIYQGQDYDCHAGPRKRGLNTLIKKGTPEARIICNYMAAGVGITEAAVAVNANRENIPDLAPVSWSAVRSFVKKSGYMRIHKRQQCKSGKRDIGSIWALARIAQMQQLKQQLGYGSVPGTPSVDLPRIFLDGVAFWDEFHLKCKLGHASKWECVMCRHPETDEVCTEEEGGVWEEEKPNTSMKFAQEARTCLGAYMRKAHEGDAASEVHEGYVGKTMELFDYTHRSVIGPASYAKKITAELARVKPLRGCWGTAGHGYEERWPDTWQAEVRARVNKDWCCITDIMDHVIDESTKAYAGTEHADDFFIFHDGLSAWWEKGAQEHMKERGFEHRQIRNITANVGNRYAYKIVGDSPEMCRALDSHGFADLKRAIISYASLTSIYDQDDPRRFSLGTPAEILRAIRRAWTVAPTSKRIVEDILELPSVLDKIIEHGGCCVPDDALRHGRRLELHSWQPVQRGRKELMHKAKASQRKGTLASCVPPHPDVEPARKMLCEMV